MKILGVGEAQCSAGSMVAPMLAAMASIVASRPFCMAASEQASGTFTVFDGLIRM